jgi:hypothetical protein
MGVFSNFKQKSREQEIDIKINSLLTSVSGDVNNFTHQEQVEILVSTLSRYKARKEKEMNEALEFANDIEQSLKQLTF